MARKLRVEYAGAICHLLALRTTCCIARGNLAGSSHYQDPCYGFAIKPHDH
jgi:hypothetical protein